jgi:hypothetical protein
LPAVAAPRTPARPASAATPASSTVEGKARRRDGVAPLAAAVLALATFGVGVHWLAGHDLSRAAPVAPAPSASASSPAPNAVATTPPVVRPSPATRASPSPVPSPSPVAVVSSPVARAPEPSPSPVARHREPQEDLNAFVWDGHLWRRTEPGHKHGAQCIHVFVGGRWRTDAEEPREYDGTLEDYQRKDPDNGLYEFRGKIYWLRGHTHSGRCLHKLGPYGWYLPEPEVK